MSFLAVFVTFLQNHPVFKFQFHPILQFKNDHDNAASCFIHNLRWIFSDVEPVFKQTTQSTGDFNFSTFNQQTQTDKNY